MAQQFLYRADVVTGFEEVSCKTVTQGVRRRGLDDAGLVQRLSHRALQILLVGVMASHEAGARIDG